MATIMTRRGPPHPGPSLRNACLEPLGLTVTGGANVLDVTRATLSNLINGRAGVSPEMAIRLAKAFGGSPETWLKLQMQYDLAQALKREAALKIQRVTPPAT
jgi:addiction module HigA family antidote